MRFECLDKQRYSLDALNRNRWSIPQSRADNIEREIAEAHELCPRYFQQDVDKIQRGRAVDASKYVQKYFKFDATFD